MDVTDRLEIRGGAFCGRARLGIPTLSRRKHIDSTHTNPLHCTAFPSGEANQQRTGRLTCYSTDSTIAEKSQSAVNQPKRRVHPQGALQGIVREESCASGVTPFLLLY